MLCVKFCCNHFTQCGLLTAYGDINLGQHWLRQWVVGWGHQAINWTNVDLTSVFVFFIHVRAILYKKLKIFVLDMSLKITNLRLLPHLPCQWFNSNNSLPTYLQHKLPTCPSEEYTPLGQAMNPAHQDPRQNHRHQDMTASHHGTCNNLKEIIRNNVNRNKELFSIIFVSTMVAVYSLWRVPYITEVPLN